MSEAVRDGWGLAVASLLEGERDRFEGEVLDIGGGAQLFARSLADAELTPVAEPSADDAGFDATALASLEDDHFDAAVCIARLGFARDPEAVVASAVRACRPGAALLLVVPHALQEDMVGARHAFTLRGLHALMSAAGLEVEYAQAVHPPGGGVLRRELAAFARQSARPIAIPDEVQGWVDVMDEQRPMLLACLGTKPVAEGETSEA